MQDREVIEGFSKLNPDQKMNVISRYTSDPGQFLLDIKTHLHSDLKTQKLYSGFSENTLSNFFLPWGIAPNFMINNRIFHVPMVTEESSVVAAASRAANYWLNHGGFEVQVTGVTKKGQVHFLCSGNPSVITEFVNSGTEYFKETLSDVSENMDKRGGGVTDMKMTHMPDIDNNYYELDVSFVTVDSMGANFINTYLENLAVLVKNEIENNSKLSGVNCRCKIIMSILSNYTPECIVKCGVSEKISNMNDVAGNMSAEEFAERFVLAVTIASKNKSRAVTHNKGILNGIDAVAIATGNDFRAIEANAHAYAARSGNYAGLSGAKIEDGVLRFELVVPLNLGTVGGLTKLHPLAKYSLEILGNPSAKELMGIAGTVGLGNNFSAVRSLVTTGIQSGHMKLHLNNILNSLEASAVENAAAALWFRDKTVSHSLVKAFLHDYRKKRNG